MKFYFAILASYLASREQRRNLTVLFWLFVVFLALLTTFTVAFQYLMEMEGQSHSWPTAVYWTLVVMSTLGFGDITFQSDLGRIFSLVVLLSGSLFILVLLPFTVIQFFFIPLMEAHKAARAPTSLPKAVAGHVILTNLGAVEEALIQMLDQSHVDYVVLAEDLPEALALHDRGYRVMLGPFDDRETYRLARADRAALVATTLSDTRNTNVAFTVRELSETVTVVATATSDASIDILELAGSTRVLRMGENLGRALARRVLGRDAKSHEIGRFDELLIAEASVMGTPLIGRSLRDINLRSHANVNVVGVWERGSFQTAGPETVIHENSVLVLAGTRDQLQQFDSLFCIYKASSAPVLIIGAGRVGRGAAAALADQGIDYRIVERQHARNRDPSRYVIGDAADLEVLKAAGIEDCSSVVITTHDDDINVFLTLYCRKLRPDVQVIARSNLERNVSTLHRAGADFVLSYAAIGATGLFNLLKRSDVLLVAEGLHAFRMPTPRSLEGKTLIESSIRRDTGCNVIAITVGGDIDSNPAPDRVMPKDSELIVIGDAESEKRFHEAFV